MKLPYTCRDGSILRRYRPKDRSELLRMQDVQYKWLLAMGGVDGTPLIDPADKINHVCVLEKNGKIVNALIARRTVELVLIDVPPDKRRDLKNRIDSLICAFAWTFQELHRHGIMEAHAPTASWLKTLGNGLVKRFGFIRDHRTHYLFDLGNLFKGI